jgi:tetratricopeptide (TPR) repeat protein
MATHFYTPPFATVEQYFRSRDIHEKERVVGDEIIAIIVSLLWTLLHGVNCYLLFWQEMPLVYAAIIHVVAGAVIALITKALHSIGRDVRLLYVLTVSSIGAGIFGAFGTFLAGTLTLVYHHFSLPFAEWYRAIYPEVETTPERELYERITSGKDESAATYSVIAFMDVMTFGTEMQKRRAITRMTDQFHPLFASAFKQALQDKSNTIRVQAASSIGKIENNVGHTLQAVEILERQHPEDATLKLGLARYYDSFAFTGILDENREAENRVKALQKYKEYLEMRPSDIDARVEAGRLLLRSGQAVQAVELFQDCIAAGYGNDTILCWLVESYFYAGRYEEVRRRTPDMVHMIGQLSEIRPRLARAIEFWAKTEEKEQTL